MFINFICTKDFQSNDIYVIDVQLSALLYVIVHRYLRGMQKTRQKVTLLNSLQSHENFGVKKKFLSEFF